MKLLYCAIPPSIPVSSNQCHLQHLPTGQIQDLPKEQAYNGGRVPEISRGKDGGRDIAEGLSKFPKTSSQ